MKELDELIARDFNMTYYTLRVLEHFERLAIIFVLLGILCLQVFLAFLPGVSPDGLRCRPAIGWKLHHKGRVFTFDNQR